MMSRQRGDHDSISEGDSKHGWTVGRITIIQRNGSAFPNLSLCICCSNCGCFDFLPIIFIYNRWLGLKRGGLPCEEQRRNQGDSFFPNSWPTRDPCSAAICDICWLFPKASWVKLLKALLVLAPEFLITNRGFLLFARACMRPRADSFDEWVWATGADWQVTAVTEREGTDLAQISWGGLGGGGGGGGVDIFFLNETSRGHVISLA